MVSHKEKYIKHDPSLILCTKIYSKGFTDMSVRTETIKCLEENLHSLAQSKHFLEQKCTDHKEHYLTCILNMWKTLFLQRL